MPNIIKQESQQIPLVRAYGGFQAWSHDASIIGGEKRVSKMAFSLGKRTSGLLKGVLLWFFLLTYFFFLLPSTVFADTLESDNYKIRLGNFNMTSGQKTSTSYTLKDTVGQTAASEFSSSGYTVKAGFQYINTLYNFSFSISDLTVELGTLTPSTFSTAQNTLTVSAPGQGYAVTAFENHPLENETSDQIPDTTCDTDACDETNADPWTNTSKYGFGFNIQGNDTPADFVDSTYFRQFADDSSGESPQTVMSSSQAVQGNSATVTYQANIDGAQAAGNYQNTITYIATPTY